MDQFARYKADTIYYSDAIADTNEECDVSIEAGRIIVRYDTDEGPVEYVGHEVGDDHFELKCPDIKGRASLHRFPGRKVLEEFWIENDERGMWRLTLSE